MRTVYPVLFTQVEQSILIEVPDMEILTEAHTLEDAIEMARDAIGLKGISIEDSRMEIPKPSAVKSIDERTGTFAQDGDSFVSLVDIDFSEYRKKVDDKAVRRNVTLPNWLNQEADKAGINVSKVLQEALMLNLGVSK